MIDIPFEVLENRKKLQSYVYTTSGGWKYYVILMLKYFPIHLIFIPVIPEISINCSSGKSHKLSKRLDSEAVAKMALKQLCSQICIYRGFEHMHASLKRAVIVDIKEK